MEWSGRPQMRFKLFCEFACVIDFHPAEYFCGVRVRQDFSDAWQRLVNLSIYHPGTSAALAKVQLADAGVAARAWRKFGIIVATMASSHDMGHWNCA